ncbi:MAG TPA: murein L,D-transpeptidase catalytic domain family protein, partial [Chitinophagaceae bacterium]
MRSQLLSISVSLLFAPAAYISNNNAAHTEKKSSITYSISNNAEALYNDLHLASIGLSQKAFEYAYKGYQYLMKKEKLNNNAILAICDFSQPSSNKRFYILDL